LVADGGGIYFQNQSSGGTARIELIHGGLLNLGLDNSAPPLTIGSLEGDSASTVQLNTHQLVIGGNGLSTTYSGGIIGGGSLVKTGSGTLILTGSSVYRGGTTITGGTLIVQARTGSATGTGAVNVTAGTLGGKGTITGAVTVGSGTGNSAFLAPGTTGPDTLTISKSLTFKAVGTYKCDLSLGQTKADQINAKGVTIQTGTKFVLQPKGFQTLAVGTVFTVINNTAATPISGTFVNLPDGAIINATAGNRLQASYIGGDGNDLTLTVVP
jgi:autotransporter-associated beta strand protein